MRALEVCSGIGGLALGLEMAGWEIAGLCEADPRCRAHLAERWPGLPVLSDLEGITDDELRAVGPVDLLAGGIPCQPWSHAGKRGGTDDERDLWPAFAELLDRTGATAVLIENVRGLASDTRGLDRIASDLERRGFSVWAASVRAADVGAPHLRDRLWICAMADSADQGRQQRKAADEQERWPAGYAGGRGGLAADRPLADGDGQGRGEFRPLRSSTEQPSWNDPDRCGDDDALADAGRAGREGGWRAAADLQLPAAERGREVGDADGIRRLEHGQAGPEQPASRSRSLLARTNPWSDARPILCRDGKTRLIPSELEVQPLADGAARGLAGRFPVAPAEPGRVARLRAIGNSVCPRQAYVPARALYEVMAA